MIGKLDRHKDPKNESSRRFRDIFSGKNGTGPDPRDIRIADIAAIGGLLGITLVAVFYGLLLSQNLGLIPSATSGGDLLSPGSTSAIDTVTPDPSGFTTDPGTTPDTNQPGGVRSPGLISKSRSSNILEETVKADNDSSLYRSYSWNFKNTTWTWQGNFSQASYNYYRSKPHNRENNYAEYVLSDYDRRILSDIVTKFKDVGRSNGFSEYENVMNIAAFVQSLNYTSDKVTTGYDEYPRYPVETLVDDGGDCEDTAILTAALINEMGYGVVLIQLPGHMAVGVKGTDALKGTYYVSQGNRFYYLETTGGARWNLGEMPKEFQHSPATLLPLVQRARLDMSCAEAGAWRDDSNLFLNENCSIKNIGVGTAKNLRLYFVAINSVGGDKGIWLPDKTLQLGDFPEGYSGFGSALMRIPLNQTARVRFYLYGDNFDPVSLLSDPMKT